MMCTREMLADVPNMRVRAPMVKYIVCMVHTLPVVRKYMIKFNTDNTTVLTSRCNNISQRARSQYRYPSEAKQVENEL